MPTLPDSHNPSSSAAAHSTGKERWGKGRGGSKWRTKRERVFRRDSYQCQSCKRRGVETFVDLHGPHHGVCDHVLPLSQGGTDDEANLETICQGCDKEKTARESRGL